MNLLATLLNHGYVLNKIVCCVCGEVAVLEWKNDPHFPCCGEPDCVRQLEDIQDFEEQGCDKW